MTTTATKKTTRTAVVLVNLGGPDSLDAVEPFLFNLFNDPAIISLPGPFRYCLARWIAWKRAPVAREIYEHLGGRSPLVPMTEKQARALDGVLNNHAPGHEFRSFVAMRYWHPMSREAAKQVRDYAPDNIVFLPLYPQYSTTTTGSSLAEWNRCAKAAGLDVPTRAVCCYPTEPGWIAAQRDLVMEAMKDLKGTAPFRILFSAHGLPKKIIEKGDPYQHQIEQTAAALATALQDSEQASEQAEKTGQRSCLDWVVCYQSKVGPLEWIGPSTEQEIERAARDGVAVMVVPVAFVSEHSETLVELDIEYRELAERAGVVDYVRVPTVGTHRDYTGGLAKMVIEALPRLSQNGTIAPGDMKCACPKDAGFVCPANGNNKLQ